MAKSIINTKNVKDADVVIVSAPYDKTASFHKGTAKGPKKVVACLDTQIEFFDRVYKKEAIDFIKIAEKNLAMIEKMAPKKALDAIRTECAKHVEAGKFVFLLGGEHSVSLGLFQALEQKYNPKDVTILHIDAHCDLRNDDSDYSSKPTDIAHSCVMRRASELGYKLVQVGIRAYSTSEYEYFSNPKNNVKVFEWNYNKKIPTIDEVLKCITTKYVYISIDVDGFDPAFMPGTGTPVQGGIEWWYGYELLMRASSEFNLIGADIVEVSPMRDSVLTEYGAAQLCYSILVNKFKNKLK